MGVSGTSFGQNDVADEVTLTKTGSSFSIKDGGILNAKLSDGCIAQNNMLVNATVMDTLTAEVLGVIGVDSSILIDKTLTVTCTPTYAECFDNDVTTKGIALTEAGGSYVEVLRLDYGETIGATANPVYIEIKLERYMSLSDAEKVCHTIEVSLNGSSWTSLVAGGCSDIDTTPQVLTTRTKVSADFRYIRFNLSTYGATGAVAQLKVYEVVII